MDRPNIFDYATSELSQDAFFAWLMKWAENDYKEVDEELHECAKKILKTFFRNQGKKIVSSFNSIEIYKQKDNIDILLRINDRYNLIIEDKTHTYQHDKQLSKYKKYFKDEKEFSCFVYIRTGDLQIPEEERMSVESDGYGAYGLIDIYNMLESCKSKNEVFISFFSRIKRAKILKDVKNSLEVVHRNNLKIGIWKDVCLYIYFSRGVFGTGLKKYFAIDVWFDGDGIDLAFHIITNARGKWLENETTFLKICNRKQNLMDLLNREYENKDTYFEKRLKVNETNTINKALLSEIKKFISIG